MNILEIGMGTGLNLLLTYLEAGKGKGIVDYIAIEPNPVPDELLFRLNYIELLEQQGLNRIFDRIHAAKWNQRNELDENFFFTKIRSRFEEFNYAPASFDLIYFDAFSPGIQPELWTVEVFSKMASLTKPGGVLVTYSAKGLVRRNLERAGFSTERLPGPKGKREILRARYL
jgi:tRNA U34 5-methylaminomethyl-2-thiouridine-forming methyltransferase MnmC